MRKKVSVSILVLACLAVLSCKSDLSKGVDSYYEGEYDKAIEHLSKIRYDDRDYDKAVRLIAKIHSIPRIETVTVAKRIFPIKIGVSGEIRYSNGFYFYGYVRIEDYKKISVGDSLFYVLMPILMKNLLV